MNPWLRETLRSGTIASLVMMPPGFGFQWAGWRIGHYGPKVANWWADHPGPALLFGQHLLIGWLSTLPLLWLLARTAAGLRPLVAAAAYGAAYYVAVNSLVLPLMFGDRLPWQLGWQTILPSLVVHIVFGASIGITARRFIAEQRSRPS
ncbi:MAG: hypothetical protein H6933_14270 [Burkholderiaceae bacterium]|nr:hypothetical protein [Rhodoferax sp.]MCP5286051.1 hypothetical protein [Burkholderiaceae bacterium]